MYLFTVYKTWFQAGSRKWFVWPKFTGPEVGLNSLHVTKYQYQVMAYSPFYLKKKMQFQGNTSPSSVFW